jgi:hypothetical protein
MAREPKLSKEESERNELHDLLLEVVYGEGVDDKQYARLIKLGKIYEPNVDHTNAKRKVDPSRPRASTATDGVAEDAK